MKTIGLIGGMSWESTLDYYRIINETVKKRLGGLHSSKCIIYSFDFEAIENLQQQQRWGEAAQLLVGAAQKLEKAGADILLICANTMHKCAVEVERSAGIPLLHIADATAKKIREKGVEKLGLLGTRFTMEQDFYKKRLMDKYGLSIIVPSQNDRQRVHDIIYKELCLGTIQASSKKEYQRIIHELISKGAEGIILGCTEIPLLLGQDDVSVPVFDTTRIHAKAAVEFAIRS